MKHFIIAILLLTGLSAYSTTFTGEVTKNTMTTQNRIIDAKTKQGIGMAKITIPQKGIQTYTDRNGNFTLPRIQIDKPSILSVQKEGYRPFSLTINNNDSLSAPLQIQIAQSEPMDIKIESEILHLGDNNFSKNSASASHFKMSSIGPYYSKDFIIERNALNSTNYLVIGSIIGLDTKLAKSLGQNHIRSEAYSTPAEIYFNGTKIGELKINGDGQRVKLPNTLIHPDKVNQITIKTGENTMAMNHIDYDDIEIMNLSILSK